MIWNECTIYRREEVGKDILNNPIYGAPLTIWTGEGRPSPWSNFERQFYGREVTENERLLLVPASVKALGRLDFVNFEGEDYEILKISELSPRWALLRVRRFKT